MDLYCGLLSPLYRTLVWYGMVYHFCISYWTAITFCSILQSRMQNSGDCTCYLNCVLLPFFFFFNCVISNTCTFSWTSQLESQQPYKSFSASLSLFFPMTKSVLHLLYGHPFFSKCPYFPIMWIPSLYTFFLPRHCLSIFLSLIVHSEIISGCAMNVLNFSFHLLA